MTSYEPIVKVIHDERDVLRAKNIFFRCRKCGEMIPSQPDDSVGCKCGNIFIDVDYLRLVVKDWKELSLLRRKAD